MSILLILFFGGLFGTLYMIALKALGERRGWNLLPERLYAEEDEVRRHIAYRYKRSMSWLSYRIRMLMVRGEFMIYTLRNRALRRLSSRPDFALVKSGPASVFLKEMVAHKNTIRTTRNS